MEKFGKSQPVTRVEDVRFLTGRGRYVDDLAPTDALYAYFFRAPMAHAEITTLDVSDARDMPGVNLVTTVDDLLAAGVAIDIGGGVVTNRDGSKGAKPVRPILAQGRVRHVGEAMAMIVAETLEQAKDAAEAIMMELEDRPVHLELDTGGPELHSEAPENLAFDWGMGNEEATTAAIKAAAHVVKVTVPDNRIICNAMETRGCFAEPEGDRLHVAINGQGVWGAKGAISKALGISLEDLRVTNPDVGGGFGMKAFNYPEYFLVTFAARTLGRAVRWMSERTEAMLTDNGGRDLVSEVTLAFDADMRMTGYHVDTIANMGAYNSGFAQYIQTELFSKVLMGTYDVQAAYMRTRGVYTNTTPVDAYRGAGRPEAIFVLERGMDAAARQMNVDPWELRRKNFIAPERFPYTTVTDVTYDVGEFAKVLDRAAETSDQAGFATRRAASLDAGKLRGRGLCYYIESILGDPTETTRVDFTEDGGAVIYVGTQSNGQGHETVFTQFLSDQTGIPADKIGFVQGDSDRIKSGGGTGGSRSATVQNNATLVAVDQIVTAFSGFLAEVYDAKASDVSFDHETFRIAGTNQTHTMLDVAELARDAGRDDLMTHSATATLPARSFPNGAHVAEVEIDSETGVMVVDRYTVVDDFGNLINPMLVEGQVHGGVAQGLGQAITERVVFDQTGQLLTATFMDYGMPRADDLPMIGFTTEGTPSTYNPMGMKGCGEAGTVGALAALTNAALDALGQAGVTEGAMPFTPHRVWGWLQEAQKNSGAI